MTNKPPHPPESDNALQALLQAAHGDHDPTELDRAAVRRALAEKLLHAPPPLDPSAVPVVGSLSPSFKLWLVAVCVVAGLGALGVFATTRRRPAEEFRAVLPQRAQTPAVVRVAAPSPPTAAGETPPASTNDAVDGARPLDAEPRLDRSRKQPTPRGRPPDVRKAARSRSRAAADMTPGVQNVPVSPAPRVETAAAPSAVERASPASRSAPASAGGRPAVAASASEAARPASVQRKQGGAPEGVTEREWMHRIERALRDGAPRLALELSAEHEQRWPRGLFAQEREGVRALAACQLRMPDDQRRARVFLSNHSESALAPRVRAECRLSATTSVGDTPR